MSGREMPTMTSVHFHPVVGMASDNQSGFYSKQQVIIDIDETHYTVATVKVDAGLPKHPIKTFFECWAIERLPLSGRIIPVNGWCHSRVAQGIADWFAENGFPLPENFYDYLLGVRNVEQLKRGDGE